MALNLGGRGRATGHVLGTRLSFRGFRECGTCAGVPLLQNFRSLACSLHLYGWVWACGLGMARGLAGCGFSRMCFAVFGLWSLAGYLRITLVFVWGGLLRAGFNFCFSGVFCWCWRGGRFWWGAECWAVISCLLVIEVTRTFDYNLDYFLIISGKTFIFMNFVRWQSQDTSKYSIHITIHSHQ